MNRLALLFATLIAALPAGVARADDYFDHIYRISTVREGKPSVELTGFKVKGREGLYTALHGVVGGKTIKAFQPSSKNVTGYELEIAEVDTDRDIAYLLPTKKGKKLSDGGLPLGVAPNLASLAEKSVKVVGFPMGVDLLAASTPLTVRQPAACALEKVGNPAARADLKKRNSPLLSTIVLSLDGNLLQGHSGAPILDADGSVIAVGNGGLDIGRVGWGWAIPFHDIKLNGLSEAGVPAKLAALGKADAITLFCVIDENARENAKKIRIETKTVIIGKDGEPAVAFTMTPKQAMTAQMDRLKEVMKLIQQGKADQLDPVKEMERLNQKMVPLAIGTTVEVVDLEDGQAAGAGAGGLPGLPGLQGLPGLNLPKLPAAGKNDDPFAQIGNMLGNAAQEVNVKVKVLDGTQKGKELWVNRAAIKRETLIRQEK
ncbi:S1 family peptidase [Zavarzinella formosa]|uniref:S1 family peptidase n=1 Tax=Zavarzinella formosa TaxID=360055 RepID=UPI00031D5233|nr:serine protease [Zavarzinella formosa]